MTKVLKIFLPILLLFFTITIFRTSPSYASHLCGTLGPLCCVFTNLCNHNSPPPPPPACTPTHAVSCTPSCATPGTCGRSTTCIDNCGNTIPGQCDACPTPPPPSCVPTHAVSCSPVCGEPSTCGKPTRCIDNCGNFINGQCNACPGVTQTTRICNASGTGYDTSSSCVASCTPAAPPTPNCTQPPLSNCSDCGVQCGNGSQTCEYTGPAPCIPQPAPPQPCNKNCPNGQNCDLPRNACRLNNTINGNVFVDVNQNTLKDAGEVNYTGAITISSTAGTVTTAAGTYTVGDLAPGQYTISYQNPPTGLGYLMTYPLNGPPPSFTVTVGSSCSPGTSNSASCSGGNIINLNFGINNAQPWIQGTGADLRIDSGFTSKIPPNASCGAYANLSGAGGTPGLIFSGASSPDFGQGQASQDPYNWVVGGLTYPETHLPTKLGGQVKTAYNFLLSKATKANITPTDLAPFCSGGIGNCTLQALPSGIYRANGNLRLTGGTYTFAAGTNAIILVNGNLNIATRILVPNGSTALFSTSGNTIVETSLGEAVVTSTASTIEGIYSSDGSFIVQGNNNCTTGADLRFNVGGAVITKAGLVAGSFQNQRNLCGGNAQCPAFSVKERADFVINSPNFLKQPNFTYQEIAP